MSSTDAAAAPAGAAARRPGRLPTHAREHRRREVLSAALEVIAERGFDRTTMQAIADRAGASKETLYSWFGGREGVVSALIESNADTSAERVTAAMRAMPTSRNDARTVLVGYATSLLTLLTGGESVALNRAAMTSPALGEALLASGRNRVGPIVEDFIGRLDRAGLLRAPDPAEAFRTLYGLVVRDTQIRVLLGETPPSARRIATDAEAAVDRFLELYGASLRP